MRPGQLWRRLTVVALLAAASLALYAWAPQYRLVGPELLQNPEFAGGLGRWNKSDGVTAANGAVMLQNKVPDRIVGIDQRIADPAPGYYGFAAEARVTAVVRGAHSGNLARLVLASLDDRGAARWSLPHTVVLLAGSDAWQHYARVFKVPPESSALWAMAQLFSATGTLEVRQLSLRRAEPLPAFLWVSRSMLGLWVVAGLWVVWPLLAAAARDRRIAAVVLVGLAIGCATQMPNTEKTELLLLLRHAEARIMAELQRAPSAADATAAEDGLAERQVSWQGLDKLGHFLMHVGLGMATLWAFRRQSRALVLSCLLLFSAVTEVWQNFAIDRDPLLSDALINMGGALTGALLVLGARQFRKLQVRPAGPPAA